MNHAQTLKDIVTLIDGDADLKHQVNLVNQYKNWKLTGREFLNLSDGEVLDLIFDIAKGEVSHD